MYLLNLLNIDFPVSHQTMSGPQASALVRLMFGWLTGRSL